ncbi:MAG TPA: sulfotransferase family protein [Acidobacteriota bacterium]|nr:sulfotransferase family protein [Acidobacteriota bacterium]
MRYTVEKPLRLCLWSGPRNVSTALMYAFAQRDDTRVFDEPLYAHYLAVTGVDHPGREAVLADQDRDGNKVVRQVVMGRHNKPVLFFKMMAHHLIQLDRTFLASTANVFLIRDPREMLPSLAQQVEHPKLGDTGLAMQSKLIGQLHRLGEDPPVLDAKELLIDPQGVLRTLCERLEIDFQPAMLEWSSGGRPEDGIWAPHWYHNVHRSEGFKPYQGKDDPFPRDLLSVLEDCRPHYDYMRQWIIRAQR